MKMFGSDSGPAKPDPMEIMQQGKQLCQIGEALQETAKALGAEEQDEGDVSDTSDMSDTSDSSDGADDTSSPPTMDPKKNAIIIAIKKKLGQK